MTISAISALTPKSASVVIIDEACSRTVRYHPMSPSPAWGRKFLAEEGMCCPDTTFFFHHMKLNIGQSVRICENIFAVLLNFRGDCIILRSPFAVLVLICSPPVVSGGRHPPPPQYLCRRRYRPLRSFLPGLNEFQTSGSAASAVRGGLRLFVE